MVVSAADRFTIENAKVRTYSDFLINFDKNPQTGFLAQFTNEDAVKQAIRNLVLTQRTERFYRAATGSKVWSLLFEPIDQVTTMSLEATIKETIKNNEPRAIVHTVQALPNLEYNMYIINVVFGIVSIPDQSFDLSLILRRVR